MSRYVKLPKVTVTLDEMNSACEFLPGRCECGEMTEPGEDFCDECKRTRARQSRDVLVFEDRTPPSEWKSTEWGMW